MKDSCECTWITNNGVGGDPKFNRTRMRPGGPLMRVACKKCRRRRWFTKELWDELPKEQKV